MHREVLSDTIETEAGQAAFFVVDWSLVELLRRVRPVYTRLAFSSSILLPNAHDEHWSHLSTA